MGVLGTLLGGVGKFLSNSFNGIAQSAGGIASTMLTNSANKQIHEDDNAFNAEQAQLNREFQADQAQNQMDFQEKMYTQYQSPEAMVDQYRKAGLNPALMYQNGGSSTGNFSGASGAGAQATAGSPIAMQSPMDALTLSLAEKNRADANYTNSKNTEQQMMNERFNEKFKAEIANLNASTEEKEAAKKLTLLSVDQKDQMFGLLKQEQELSNAIKAVEKRIAEATEDTAVDQAKAELELTKQNIQTNKAQQVQLLASAGLQETEAQAILERLPAEVAELGMRAKQEASEVVKNTGDPKGMVGGMLINASRVREQHRIERGERQRIRANERAKRHNVGVKKALRYVNGHYSTP